LLKSYNSGVTVIWTLGFPFKPGYRELVLVTGWGKVDRKITKKGGSESPRVQRWPCWTAHWTGISKGAAEKKKTLTYKRTRKK